MAAKKTTPEDAILAACLAAPNVAAFARAMDRPEKPTRNTLRTRLGVYVSKGSAWDDRTKTALHAYITAPNDAKQGVVDAFKEGK